MVSDEMCKNCLSKIKDALYTLEHAFPKSLYAAQIELLLKSVASNIELEQKINKSGANVSLFDILVLSFLLVEKKVLSKEDIKGVLSASLLKEKLIQKSVLDVVDIESMSNHCEDIVDLVRAFYSSTSEDKHNILKKITGLLDARTSLKT